MAKVRLNRTEYEDKDYNHKFKSDVEAAMDVNRRMADRRMADAADAKRQAEEMGKAKDTGGPAAQPTSGWVGTDTGQGNADRGTSGGKGS